MLSIIVNFLITTQIISGTIVPDMMPIVSVGSVHSKTCAGSIINREWVLTAAHCVNSDMKYFVYYGSTSQLEQDRMEVKEVFIHPGYDTSPDSVKDEPHDIALLKVSKPVFNNNFNLGKVNEEIPGKIYGWGLTESGFSSFQLLKAETEVVTQEQCSIMYGGIHDSYFCVGEIYSSENICSGDSGGPFVQGDTVVGVASWSYNDCTNPLYHSGFTDVGKHIDWINKTINNNKTSFLFLPFVESN